MAPLALLFALVAGCGGGASYDVTVRFDESVQDADLQAVERVIKRYDGDADVLLLESFPPILKARVRTDAGDFCAKLTRDLEEMPPVSGVDCTKAY
ncbi:MAG TPA: hypothetical protein VFX28_09870 [Methylomirabilota bacterium]|nr:hypothetical protein [Methylomirabilota bacterium]